MKYVKLTDNRIYDVGHLKIDGPIKDGLSTELFVAHSGKSYGSSMPGVVSLNHLCNVNDIVGEADAIEELCDGFLTDRDGLPFAFRPKKHWLDKDGELDIRKYALEEYLKYKKVGRDIVLWGYVRTDKGLLYVAKANDKGELELL